MARYLNRRCRFDTGEESLWTMVMLVRVGSARAHVWSPSATFAQRLSQLTVALNMKVSA